MEYSVHPPVCFWCLPDCISEGCCKLPFYVFTAGKDSIRDSHDGKIFGTTLTTLTVSQIDFPANSSSDSKLRLVGTALFLNEMYLKTHVPSLTCSGCTLRDFN